jgi:hypothetical protein
LSGADLEASIGGGDVERGEAVVEGGAAGEGAVGGEVGGQGVEVPELRGAEEVVLVAGAGAAHPVPHVPGFGSGGGGGGGGSGDDSSRRRRSGVGGRRPGTLKWEMGKERRTVFTPFYCLFSLSSSLLIACFFFLFVGKKKENEIYLVISLKLVVGINPSASQHVIRKQIRVYIFP